MDVLLSTYALVFGLIIGSFLNVVIYRYPREESLVSPPSRCPRCGARVRPWDNVPVLSWLVLRGRCRDCHEPISPRYPLVELANGLFYLAIFQRTGPSLPFLLTAAIVSMTIALIFIDLDIQILPDAIDLPGVLVGLGIGAVHAGCVVPGLMLSCSLFDSAAGAALGAGFLYGTALLYKAVRGIEGMGLGDVKMLAMIGAVFGWMPLLPVLFLASILGAVVGVALSFRSSLGMLQALPFGVFLGFATLVALFFGDSLAQWYRLFLLY